MSLFLSRSLPRIALLLALPVIASVFLITEPAQAGWGDQEVRLTVDVSPEQGGFVTVDSDRQDEYPATLSYESGSTIELTAVPSPSYTFAEWTGDVEDNGNQSTSIVITCDKTVMAVFAPAQPTFAWWWLAAGIGVLILIIVPLVYLRFVKKPSASGE